MSKFSGMIGFVSTVEKEDNPGVWVNITTEKHYTGDIVRSYFNSNNNGVINDNITISNNISIISNSYINENFQYMKYIKFKGVKWKITNIEIQPPRLIISTGGLYNET